MDEEWIFIHKHRVFIVVNQFRWLEVLGVGKSEEEEEDDEDEKNDDVFLNIAITKLQNYNQIPGPLYLSISLANFSLYRII